MDKKGVFSENATRKNSFFQKFYQITVMTEDVENLIPPQTERKVPALERVALNTVGVDWLMLIVKRNCIETIDKQVSILPALKNVEILCLLWEYNTVNRIMDDSKPY